MPAVIWSDGSVTRSRTWQGVLDKVRALQWHELSEEDFRYELGKRAWRWSETEIDFEGSPKALFLELERAHMVVIERGK